MNLDGGRFEVSAGTLVLLALATIASSAAVFVLGIYVGKGMTEDRIAQEAKLVRVPVTAGQAKGGDVEVTFWDRLAKGETPGVTAAAPTATEVPIRIMPSPAPTAAPPRSTPATHAAEPATPAPRAAPPVAPLAASDQGSYQVQVNALADRPAADHLVRELDGKGYKAVISPAKVGARTLYRVRVGRFATEESARKAVAHLREIGYPRSFVAAEPQ